MKILILVLTIVVILTIPIYAQESKLQAIFFAVHMEAGTLSDGVYQREQWPNLIALVSMADRYEAKLTLMFNPQWAEYILNDKNKFSLVKKWQKNGHEVALHFHNVFHPDWNGYTNRTGEMYTSDPRYRGSVDDMMKLIRKLAAPEHVQTMCMGVKENADNSLVIEIDPADYPKGILYDVDGFKVGLSPISKTELKGRTIFHLKHHALLCPPTWGNLDSIKDEFNRAKNSEVLGVVTHEADFGRDPSYFEQWFRFLKDKGIMIKTVREIVKTYPAQEIIEKKYVLQEGDPIEVVFKKVNRLHELMRLRESQGRDIREAKELDTASRRAAESGDREKVGQLLDEAIRSLEKL